MGLEVELPVVAESQASSGDTGSGCSRSPLSIEDRVTWQPQEVWNTILMLEREITAGWGGTCSRTAWSVGGVTG